MTTALGCSPPGAHDDTGFDECQISNELNSANDNPAWTAEALKGTMPASVFSRSTECHNQDKVSMGTIAARDCLRVLELTEQVVAAVLIAGRQALALRDGWQPGRPDTQPDATSMPVSPLPLEAAAIPQ